jgi:mono/diheme cytochrome c family protein
MKFFRFLSLTLLLTQSQFAQKAPGKPVTEAEKTGQKLFFQRCSVCHMGAAPAYRLYGPPVYGDVVRSLGDDAVRKKILDGSPAMPAWKYTFKPADVDKIIAFMKTLTKDDVVRQPTGKGDAEDQ